MAIFSGTRKEGEGMSLTRAISSQEDTASRLLRIQSNEGGNSFLHRGGGHYQIHVDDRPAEYDLDQMKANFEEEEDEEKEKADTRNY